MNRIFLKAIVLILCVCLALSLTGCKKKETISTSSNDDIVSSEVDNTSSDEEIVDEEPTDVDDDYASDDDSDYDDSQEIDYFNYLIDRITVKNNDAPIENDFLGLNGVQHCYTYINDDFGRNYTEKQAQEEFNRMKKMGVGMIRTYYDEEYAYNTKDGSWDWQSEDMKAVYKWMLELQKRDITVACNAGWSIKGAYEKNTAFPWTGTFVEGDIDATIKNKASWMKESLENFRANGIYNVEYIILTTEPGDLNSYDEELVELLKNTKLEDTDKIVKDVDVWLNYARTLHNTLVAEGTRNLYQFVGPNTTYRFETKDNPTKLHPIYYFAIKEASDIIDVYSHHNYPNIASITNNTIAMNMEYDIMIQDRIDMAKNIGKKFWYDETNLKSIDYSLAQSKQVDEFSYQVDSPFESLHVGSYFIDSMTRGVQNVMWWYLFDQQWPDNVTDGNNNFENGLHHWGCAPSLMESYVPHQSYYGISLLTKYFGNHAKVFETESEYQYFDVGVQQDKDDEWTIAVTNFEVENGYLELSFDKNIGSQKFYRHVYSINESYPTKEAEIIPADKIVSTNGDKLVDKIPSSCLVVYTTIKE